MESPPSMSPPPPPQGPPPQGPRSFDGAPGPDYLKAAMIGGLLAGIPSAFVSCCCFMFFGIGGWFGAVVAARTAPVFRLAEGAIAGLAAAVGRGVLYAVIYAPLAWWAGRLAQEGRLPLPNVPGLPPDFAHRIAEQGQPHAIAVHLIVAAVVFLVTSTAGGAAYGLYLNRGASPPGVAPPPGH